MTITTNAQASQPRLVVSPTVSIWTLSALLGLASFMLNRFVLAGAPSGNFRFQNWWGFVLLAALFAVGEILVIHVNVGRSAHSLSISEALLVVGLFHTSPSRVAGFVLVGGFATLAVVRRQTPIKLVFNLVSFVFCSQLAAVALLVGFGRPSLRGPMGWLASFLAVEVYTLAGALLVFAAISLSGNAVRRSTVSATLKIGVGASIVTGSAGVVASILLFEAPLATPLVLIPLGGAYLSNRVYARERRRIEELEFLHNSTDAIRRTQASELTTRKVIEAALQALHLQYIEVETLEDGKLRRTIVTDQGPTTSSTDLTSVFELGITETTKCDRARVCPEDLLGALHQRGLSGGTIVPIRSGTGIIGALLVGDPESSAGVIDREMQRLAETLASQIAVVVENGRLERSVVELRELESRMVFELQHDALTGLYNRTTFNRVARKALATPRRANHQLGVAMIDLDDFKRINDVHGHAAGDALLLGVAARLNEVLRADDIAARFGGDEFGVLFTALNDLFEAEVVAGRIVESLNRPIRISDDLEIVCRASVGLALAGSDDVLETLLERGDMAMYRAKAAGKGTFDVIDSTMDEHALGTTALIRDLAEGLDLEQFEVVYQPVVDIATGETISLECLLRWRHPKLGLLQPSSFLGLGDLVASRRLDDFVLKAACSAAAQVKQLVGRSDFVVGINLRNAQVVDDRLVDALRKHTSEAGIEFSDLSLEVDEDAFARSPESTMRRLVELRDLGLQVAIDNLSIDTLAYKTIEELQPKIVKLGHNVTSQMSRPAAIPVIRSLAELGDILGFALVAKGVELEEEAIRAFGAGCTLAQGHYFERPASLSTVKANLRSANKNVLAHRSSSGA